MKNKIPSFLLHPQPHPKAGGGSVKVSFIDKGVGHISAFYETVFLQWELSQRDGLFQRLNARTKVLFLVLYLFIVSVKKDVPTEVLTAVFILPFVVMSRVGILAFYRRVITAGFFFGFIAGVPAVLNVITPGEPVYTILELRRQYDFWIYHVPQTITVTREGTLAALMLTARVANSVSITLLVVCTTPFSEVVKALKVFRVPEYFLMILTLSQKYAFIFLKMLRDMHTAKKARLTGAADAAHWIAGRAAYIFKKTQLRCEDVYKAMAGRGFTGEVKLAKLEKTKTVDIIAGAMFLTLWMLLLIL
ncbi:cobalt ECF transporter T component CbiQ [Candidatus Magnetominusculus dajiuhuensis]|uniref:cobalt ECF transporter T component CbiQ n=1 Tax=Candidatus Magnetominusculus dajiuhuensis TaxID=3137712 RepID=UPI003B42A58D